MEIIVEKVNEVAVVAMPVAELDAANSAEFKRDMAPVLDAHTKVVFDLTRLRFIDIEETEREAGRPEAVRYVEAGPHGH
jgi:anti-anti-sigma regulatory factor